MIASDGATGGATAPAPAGPGPERRGGPGMPLLEGRRPGPGRLAGFVLLFLVTAMGLAVFSAFPWAASPPGTALLKVAFKHVAPRAKAGRALSREELERLPRHMRPQGGVREEARAREETVLRVRLDDRVLLERTYRPSGFQHDGPTFVYEELALPLGRHRLRATLVDPGETPGREAEPEHRQRLDTTVDIRAGQVLLLELSARDELVLR